MAFALDSGWSGPGSSPGRDTFILAKTLGKCLSPPRLEQISTSELFEQPDRMLGIICDGLASHPGEFIKTHSDFMLRKPG